MKYSTIAVAAFVAVASAQADISIIPDCAIPCIDEAAAKASKCEAKDFKCICTNVEAIVPAATTCVLAECGNAVALNEVLPATETFCKAVLAGGDDEPTPEPSSTAAEPSSTSAAPVESSAEPSSVATATASDTTSVEPVSSYPASSIATSVVPTSAAPTTSAPASTSPVTAGAAGVAGSFGLLLLGAFAAL